MADPGVRAGAVLGGFETEGGYNGRNQPAHSWCWWEAEGKAPRRPSSDGFWQGWDADVARVAAAGFETVRVSVEWARCEPLDGRVDLGAVAGYCRLLDRCHEHGLQPVVVLHRFAHPAWMGVDFWLRADSPERFCSWVETAVEHFAGRTHQWVTIDQLNATALFSYLSGRHPPGRRLDVGASVRSLDHLLAAHVLAYEAIKERQPHGVVATGNRHQPVYELDRLLVDVLLGRAAGVGRHDLHDWLVDRRAALAAAAPRASFWGRDRRPGRAILPPEGPARRGGRLAGVARRLAASAVPLEQALARSVAAVYDSACDRSIDVLEVSAEAGDLLRTVPLPGTGNRVAWWSDHGGQLEAACLANRDLGLPLSVVGDTPVGVNRLRTKLAEVERAAAAGAPVTTYHQRVKAGALERLAGDDVAPLSPSGRATAATTFWST